MKTATTPPVTIIDISSENAEKIAKILSGYVNEDGEVIVRGIRFPKMNKNHTLRLYREELERGFNEETVIVPRYVMLDNETWDDLTNSLMDSERFIFLKDEKSSEEDGRWNGVGGSNLSPAKVKELGWENITDVEILNSEEKMKTYRKHCRTIAVAVGNGTETIFINCEGYSYARYVGL